MKGHLSPPFSSEVPARPFLQRHTKISWVRNSAYTHLQHPTDPGVDQLYLAEISLTCCYKCWKMRLLRGVMLFFTISPLEHFSGATRSLLVMSYPPQPLNADKESQFYYMQESPRFKVSSPTFATLLKALAQQSRMQNHIKMQSVLGRSSPS